MKNTGPITPAEAKAGKIVTIPSQVYEAFNELLTERAGDDLIVITQREVTERILSKFSEDDGITAATIFDKQWLDVEGAYRKAGWKVEYDKPGYNESYEATFRFSRKR